MYAIIKFLLFRLVQVLVISFGGVYGLVFINLTIVASLEQYENKVSYFFHKHTVIPLIKLKLMSSFLIF